MLEFLGSCRTLWAPLKAAGTNPSRSSCLVWGLGMQAQLHLNKRRPAAGLKTQEGSDASCSAFPAPCKGYESAKSRKLPLPLEIHHGLCVLSTPRGGFSGEVSQSFILQTNLEPLRMSWKNLNGRQLSQEPWKEVLVRELQRGAAGGITLKVKIMWLYAVVEGCCFRCC